MLDYAKSEFAIDSDNDKLAFIFESEPFLEQSGLNPMMNFTSPAKGEGRSRRGVGSGLPFGAGHKK